MARLPMNRQQVELGVRPLNMLKKIMKIVSIKNDKYLPFNNYNFFV